MTWNWAKNHTDTWHKTTAPWTADRTPTRAACGQWTTSTGRPCDQSHPGPTGHRTRTCKGCDAAHRKATSN